jgi:hypothetical protein
MKVYLGTHRTSFPSFGQCNQLEEIVMSITRLDARLEEIRIHITAIVLYYYENCYNESRNFTKPPRNASQNFHIDKDLPGKPDKSITITLAITNQ